MSISEYKYFSSGDLVQTHGGRENGECVNLYKSGGVYFRIQEELLIYSYF